MLTIYLEDKIDLKDLEKVHQANKKKFDRKGHISNTEALLEKIKNKERNA